MYKIGINWEQNSTISLFKNDKLIFVSSEERFSKVKNDERFPIKVLRYIFEYYNIKKEGSLFFSLFSLDSS